MNVEATVIERLRDAVRLLKKEVPEELDKFLDVNPFEAQKLLGEHPAIFSFVSEQHDDLKQKKEELEEELNVLLAEKYIAYKENPPNGMKVTEKTIESLVASDKQVVLKKQQINVFRSEERKASSLMSALRHRKDILLTMAGGKATPTEF